MRKLILLASVCIVLCHDGVTGESLFAAAKTASRWNGRADAATAVAGTVTVKPTGRYMAVPVENGAPQFSQ